MLYVTDVPAHTGPAGSAAMLSVGAGDVVSKTATVAVAAPLLHKPAVGVTSTCTWSPLAKVLLVKVGPVAEATATPLTSQR
jgi:hypothetical protein